MKTPKAKSSKSGRDTTPALPVSGENVLVPNDKPIKSVHKNNTRRKIGQAAKRGDKRKTEPTTASTVPAHKRETVEAARVQTAQLPQIPGESAPSRNSTEREQQLVNEVKRQTGQLEAINNVITAAIRSPNLNQTLQAALEAALSVIPLEASGISLIDKAAGELVMWAQRGWKYDFTTTPMRIKIGEGLSGLAITTGEVIITGDVKSDSRLVVPAFADEEVKAMALVPMRARGQVIGVLSVMSRTPYHFSEGEIKTLRVIADQVGLALDNVQLYESVRAQRSRLETVINSTADAIIATDDHGNINLVNQAAETLFDLKAEAILGKPLREAPFFPALSQKMQTAMLRDETGENHSTTSRMVEGKMGDERYVLGFVSPVYSPQGQHDSRQEHEHGAWVAVFQDISHLKQAEMARVSFIQMAAHELRNPLSVTNSALIMLGSSLQSPTEQEVYNIAMRGINRMQDLIDDLLDLERIESGAGMRADPVNIPELIERCLIDMKPVLDNKNQALVLDVAPSLPIFDGDERWLYRALVNLVSNAHKYTPENTRITIHAEARLAQEGRRELVLQVEDNGPGIPREALSHLFERFYRARRTEQKVQGTGLGLAIVKSVAEKHQGYVFVHSELPLFSALWKNRGSTFGMVMPYPESNPSA
jgi:PAS domain S-box-containing protein